MKWAAAVPLCLAIFWTAPALADAGLIVPDLTPHWTTGRDFHSEHHPPLISELQAVVRQYPDANW